MPLPRSSTGPPVPGEWVFEIEGDLDVRLVGERIAHATSEQPDKTLWQEITIYRSSSTGSYVVEEAGVSRIPRDDILARRLATPDPHALVEFLYRQTDDEPPRRFLTKTAMAALRAASEHDAGIANAIIRPV